jgi:hypothetical protein
VRAYFRAIFEFNDNRGTRSCPAQHLMCGSDPRILRGIREALGSLIRSVDVQAKALASVPEFLNEGRPDGPTCLVLDVRLA